MSKKNSLTPLATAFALLTLWPRTTKADETADKIAELRKLRENIPLVHMVTTSVSRSGAGTRETRIETWEKNGNGKQRLRRLATPVVEPGTPKEKAAAPILMVKDGETAWREMDLGDRKLVFKGSAEVRTEYNEMEPVLKDKIVKIGPSETLLDQPCVLLEVREKANPEDIIASYWISTKTGIVLKSVVENSGETITENKVTELNLNDSFSIHLFDYKPPGDAQVLEDKSSGTKKPD